MSDTKAITEKAKKLVREVGKKFSEEGKKAKNFAADKAEQAKEFVIDKVENLEDAAIDLVKSV